MGANDPLNSRQRSSPAPDIGPDPNIGKNFTRIVLAALAFYGVSKLNEAYHSEETSWQNRVSAAGKYIRNGLPMNTDPAKSIYLYDLFPHKPSAYLSDQATHTSIIRDKGTIELVKREVEIMVGESPILYDRGIIYEVDNSNRVLQSRDLQLYLTPVMRAATQNESARGGWMGP